MSAYSTDDLLIAIRDYVQFPDFDEGSDARLTRLLNREQSGYIQQILQSTAENYRTTQASITVVTGQLAYDIPTRAIASGLKMVQAYDSGGLQWMCTELRPEDIQWWRQQWVSPCQQFYLYRNQIVFYAQPPAGTLTVTYPMRLSEMVAAAACGVVATKPTPTTFTFTGTLATGSVDFIQSAPQFDTLAMDQTCTVVSTTGTIAAGVPARAAIGCYVAAAGTTPVCQAPLEMHSLLALRVAYVSLQAKGDPQAPALEKQLSGMKADVMKLLEPRPSKPRSIISFTGPGWSRGYYGTRGRW